MHTYINNYKDLTYIVLTNSIVKILNYVLGVYNVN